ncbi:MAG: flagellar biosynthetic protein FliO [Lachnospiraceae bacterium]|nr:flagellar biosynthetic protein FliO [Lachnospiraceae bacterium]
MSVFLIGTSTFASFIKLIILLIFFVLILFASYYFTRWYAKSGMLKNKSQNIHVVESFSMGPGKQICILKLGEKYVAVAVCKEQITVLTELDEGQLSLEEVQLQSTSFGEVFGEMVKQQLKKSKKR